MRQASQQERLYMAAVLLERQPEMGPLKEWLTERFEAEAARCRAEVNDVEMRRAQGRSLAFEEVLQLIKDAPSVLEKLRAK